MKYLGKQGEYRYYEGYVKDSPIIRLLLKNLLLSKGDMICGGAALNIYTKLPYNDIDIWGTTSSKDRNITLIESRFAHNTTLMSASTRRNVQFIKVIADKPREVLDAFDIDICKCAAYNITKDKFMFVVHEYVNQYKKGMQGFCKVNATNNLTLKRLHKYADKLQIPVSKLFSTEDYTNSLLLAGFVDGLADKPIEEVQAAVSEFLSRVSSIEEEYEVVEHLRGLFAPVDATGIFDTTIFPSPPLRNTLDNL